MKKFRLEQIQNNSDFVNAILHGANIDDTIKGEPLVKYFFWKASNCYYLSNEQEKIHAKFVYLVSAGADLSSIIGSPKNTSGRYKEALANTLNHLRVLNVLLKTEAAKEAILANEIYWSKEANPEDFYEEITEVIYNEMQDNYNKVEELLDSCSKEETIELLQDITQIEQQKRKTAKKENGRYLKPLVEIIKLLKELEEPVAELEKRYREEF